MEEEAKGEAHWAVVREKLEQKKEVLACVRAFGEGLVLKLYGDATSLSVCVCVCVCARACVSFIGNALHVRGIKCTKDR